MSYAPLDPEPIVTNGSFTPDPNAAFLKPISKRPRRSASETKPPQSSHGAFDSNYPVIVHSHLCWDWVWRRPQQFLSRLSARHKILFVETVGPDPELSSAAARFWTAAHFPNVTILRL